MRKLCDRFGVSERRACRVVTQHRSSQRYCRSTVPDEAALRAKLKALAIKYPRYGYRRIHVLSFETAGPVTASGSSACGAMRGYTCRLALGAAGRTQSSGQRGGRASRSGVGHGLRIRRDQGGETDQDPQRHRRVHPGVLGQLPRPFDQCGLHSVGHEELVEWRGAPAYVRCDNGPELVSEGLRDWCRFERVTTSYIEPGAPWQNAYVESFNGHLRRELLEMESFDTLFEAKVLIDDRRLEYNHYRPHMSLGYLTPAEFARTWRAEHQHDPELS